MRVNIPGDTKGTAKSQYIATGGWRGEEVPLWRVFGAVVGLWFPQWVGFFLFTLVLTLLLWLVGIAAKVLQHNRHKTDIPTVALNVRVKRTELTSEKPPQAAIIFPRMSFRLYAIKVINNRQDAISNHNL
jgi:hypothetical protein